MLRRQKQAVAPGDLRVIRQVKVLAQPDGGFMVQVMTLADLPREELHSPERFDLEGLNTRRSSTPARR